MNPISPREKECVKQFLFDRQAWFAPGQAGWYRNRPGELRALKRRYRKILRRARAKIGPGLGDYHTIYLAYELHKKKNVYAGWKRGADGSWKVKAERL